MSRSGQPRGASGLAAPSLVRAQASAVVAPEAAAPALSAGQAGRNGAAAPAPLTGTARLLRTAGLVTVITTLGSLLGLLRDVFLARYFGASAQTDAFLVSWTLPETATPLLMEGALAYLLVPLMARELEVRGNLDRITGRTLVPTVAALALLSGVIAVFAPQFVHTLAPGLADPQLAVRCARAASLTILFLGTAGYLMAALRASNQFFVPAWVYVAYNVGILACIVPFHARYGVVVASAGLSVGGALMIAVQLPAFLRRVSLRGLHARIDRHLLLGITAFFPIGLYTLGRQAQVYIERFLGSDLTSGAISHLNYAEKIAQIPMIMATTVAMISMPALSRHAAAGRRKDLTDGVEHNLRLGVLLILPAMVAIICFAPQIVRILFERGAFVATDTSATARVMAVYTVGLLGQTMVGITTVCFFSLGRRTWYPGICAVLGLLATVVISATTYRAFGIEGLAAGNATGITVCAALLLLGVWQRVARVDVAALGSAAVRMLLAAVAAGGVALLVRGALGGLPPIVVLVLGGLALLVTYGVAAFVLGVSDVRDGVRALRRRRSTGGTGSTGSAGSAADRRAAAPGQPGRTDDVGPLAAPVLPALDLLPRPPRRHRDRRRTERGAVQRRMGVVAVVAVAGAAVGVGVAATIPATYTATATLLVSASGRPAPTGSVNYTQAAARLATKPSILDATVSRGMLSPASKDQLRAVATPDSPLFELDADAPSAQAAQQLCNQAAAAVSSVLTERAGRTGFRVTVATYAVTPDAPVSPDRRVTGLVGLLLGGMVGLIGVVVRAGRPRD